MIEAVLFDLDGTVADTNDLVYASFRRLFEKLEIEVEDDIIYSFFGEPLENSLRKYSDTPEELVGHFRDFNEKKHDQMIKPFDGVVETLELLLEKGIKLGIVTSKRENMAKRSLEALKLSKYFSVVVTPEYTRKHKPYAEPLLKACELLGGIDPSHTIMVGDATYDILCGNKAGAHTVGVTYSMISLDVLKAAKPDFMVDNLRELLPIIEKLNGEEA